MSSERVQDPLGGRGTVAEGDPRPGAGGQRLNAADGPPFAVDWQVRPSPATEGAADLGVEPENPARGFTFDIARALGTVVVSARGMVDEAGAGVLKQVLVDLIENQGNMTVVVDLHGVTDVDPRCVDVFVAAHHWAIIRGGELALTGVRHQVARALEVTGVDRLVKVTTDRILAIPASR